MAKAAQSWTDSRALILRNGREFLLLRPNSNEGTVWEFPGGRAEPRESPEAALRRHCKRMLGVEVNFVLGQPPFVYDFGTHRVAYRFYECSMAGGEPKARDGMEIRWIQSQQMRDYVFDPPTQQVVEWLLGDGKPD